MQIDNTWLWQGHGDVPEEYPPRAVAGGFRADQSVATGPSDSPLNPSEPDPRMKNDQAQPDRDCVRQHPSQQAGPQPRAHDMPCAVRVGHAAAGLRDSAALRSAIPTPTL